MGGYHSMFSTGRMGAFLMTLLVIAPVFAVTASATVGDTHAPVAYASHDWRYQQVANGAGAGFEATGFDDSAWSVGQGGFGSNNGCPLVPNTLWNLNTDMLLRRTFTIDRPFSALQVGVAIDNNVQVWLNGVDISGGMRTSGGCAVLDRYVFTAPDGVGIVGENVLAIRGHDFGGVSYLDARVQYTEEGAPVPVPELSSMLLVSVGLVAMLGIVSRRR